MLLQLLVKGSDCLQLLRVPLSALCQCHGLHILFAQHVTAAAVFIHGQHLREVVGVKAHLPFFAGVLPECQVEGVVIALNA